MSTIELNWRERKISGAQTPRKFLDFVIDGSSFYDLLYHDLISPLGWFLPEYHEKAVGRFLLEEPSDFTDGRRSIFVCGECGDLGCGALSAFIEKNGDQVIWRDFVYQNNYDPDIAYGDYSDLGPFSFHADLYAQTIGQAITLNNRELDPKSNFDFEELRKRFLERWRK